MISNQIVQYFMLFPINLLYQDNSQSYLVSNTHTQFSYHNQLAT